MYSFLEITLFYHKEAAISRSFCRCSTVGREDFRALYWLGIVSSVTKIRCRVTFQGSSGTILKAMTHTMQLHREVFGCRVL